MLLDLGLAKPLDKMRATYFDSRIDQWDTDLYRKNRPQLTNLMKRFMD
jgi:hypothetical protein